MAVMRRKGIFFTFAAIAMAIILILGFQSSNISELKDDTDVAEVRILTMNNFLKDIEQDLEKGLRISSFRAFASMNEFIAANGSYIDDVEIRFEELIINGTLMDTNPSLMQDSTFLDWAQKIALQAARLDITVAFSVQGVQINQTSTWDLEVLTLVNITVNDTKRTSSWQRERQIRSKVTILDFEDPLYLINSDGKITNKILSAPTTQFTQNGDVTNLLMHANASYYIPSASAPSYLQRIMGDFTNSTNGIESLVNVQEFQEQGFSALDRSIVDYIYFGSQNTVNYRINDTPSWFKLDSGHLVTYQAENLTN